MAMIYGIYKDRICGFDLEGRFVANFDSIPPQSIVYSTFSDIGFPNYCVSFEYLYWSIERTHYRNLERNVMRNIYSEHAFTRQFRQFLEHWGRCSLDESLVNNAMRIHGLFHDAQTILNANSINVDGSSIPNRYLYGTASGRFTNVSGKRNLLALSKEDKGKIKPRLGYFAHLDMKAFHFNIIRNLYGIEVPDEPYDYVAREMGVDRNAAKLLCLRWMNSDERSFNAPKFIKDVWNLQDSFGFNAKQFNYKLQMEENRTMCEIIVTLHSLLNSLGLKFAICNYCYDSISIDCSYKASKVISSLFSNSKYYSNVVNGYPFTFELKKGIF